MDVAFICTFDKKPPAFNRDPAFNGDPAITTSYTLYLLIIETLASATLCLLLFFAGCIQYGRKTWRLESSKLRCEQDYKRGGKHLLQSYTRCFIKKWHPFSFFHNLLKWLSIYTKFLPAIAEEIPIQNVWLLVKHSLLVVMQLWHHNVQSCLSQMVQYCSQLLPCFDGELNLVHWWKIFIMSALSNIGNEIRRPAIQKLNHLASSVRCCTVLL